MPGRSERARRTGIHQHVVVGRAHVGAIVDAVERPGGAPAESGARGPVVGQLHPSQRAVAHPGHAYLHAVLGPVAAGQVLVLARQRDLDWPVGLFRQMGGQGRVRQAGALGSEVAADETVDHADPGVGQVEIIGQFGARLGDRFGAAVHDQPARGVPVGHRGVGFQATMRLDRRGKLLLDDRVGDLDRVRHVAPVRAEQRARGRAEHVAVLLRPLGGLPPFPSAGHNDRRIRAQRSLETHHERPGPIADADRGRGVLRLLLRVRGHRRDFVSLITNPPAVEHVHSPHPGQMCSRRGIDRFDRSRGIRRADDDAVQHVRQPHVAGVHGLAGDFGAGVHARHRFPDDAQPRRGVPRPRLIVRNAACLRGQRAAVPDLKFNLAWHIHTRTEFALVPAVTPVPRRGPRLDRTRPVPRRTRVDSCRSDTRCR